MTHAWLAGAIVDQDHLQDLHLGCAMISETATTPTHIATREEEVLSEDILESDPCHLLEPVGSLLQAIETKDLHLVVVLVAEAEQMVMQK